MATSRRRFTVGAASAASAALLTVLTPRVGCAVDVELYKNLNVEDPYLLMEPAGESFRGNKGPNLQMPEELSEEDDEPEALSARIRAKPSIDLFEDLSTVEIAACAVPPHFIPLLADSTPASFVPVLSLFACLHAPPPLQQPSAPFTFPMCLGEVTRSCNCAPSSNYTRKHIIYHSKYPRYFEECALSPLLSLSSNSHVMGGVFLFWDLRYKF